eukprot:TRINITY_DN69403_c0_g1_i1.p1 TRINITY_DN69403_c0_g1~~TRINITY_DN69403_c0_g1_i1.p1  ORF type:complete len:264 (+),score=18.57 TRINITY_DN69403_c0_g1_i1:192-983(+)
MSSILSSFTERQKGGDIPVAWNDPENLRYDKESGPNVPWFDQYPEFVKRYLTANKAGILWDKDVDAPTPLQSWIQEYAFMPPFLLPAGVLNVLYSPDILKAYLRGPTWEGAPWFLEAWRRGGFYYNPGEESTRMGGLVHAKAHVRMELPNSYWICTPLNGYKLRSVPPPDEAGAYESFLHLADFREWKHYEWNIWLHFQRTVKEEFESCVTKLAVRNGYFECRHLLSQYEWLISRQTSYAKWAALARGVRALPLPPGREDETW